MSSYNEENLIENVRAHKSLYDIFSVDYKDQNIRKEAWEEIGGNLQMSAEKCMSEWTKLRNCFLNSIRRRRNKTSGQSTKHIPPWKYSQQMEFLLPFLENREIHNNLETCNKTQSQSTNSVPGDIEPPDDALIDIELEDNRSFIREKEVPIKRKKLDYAGEMVEIMRENSSMRKQRYEKKISTGLDEVEMFYLSMAKIAKRLPKSVEAKLRMEICNKVSQAELACLSEIEILKQQPPAVSHQNKISTQPAFSNSQSQSVYFQPQNLSLNDEHSQSSWSSTSTITNRVYATNPNPNYKHQQVCTPTLNTQLNCIQPYEYVTEESSSNQYEPL